MLGKGLESLIPPQKPTDGVGQAPQGSGAPHVPPTEPVFVASVPTAVPGAFPPTTPAIAAGSEPAYVPPSPSKTSAGSLGGQEEKLLTRDPSHKLSDAVFHIEVDKISPNPHQPRKDFNEEHLRDLAASIREFGILQPLVVTKIEKEVPTGTAVEYQLIAGERRLMAARLAGLERVPVIVRKVADKQEHLELAIIENLQRQNLNPIETARAFARLQDEFRLTQREIATQLGKSREVIANTLRLLDLPSHIQDAISRGDISESHGRLLLTVDESALQEKLFKDLVENRFTIRELRDRVDAATRPMKQPGAVGATAHKALPADMHMFQEKLSSELGAPVKIESHGGSGKIMITFYSKEELEHIVGKLKSGE